MAAILPAMASLDVRVLGPLEVMRDGAVVPLASRMQRRLLLTLVLARPTTISMDRLADELWDHDPPRSARNSLQTHVARLRAHLGADDVIVTRPPGYALAEDAVRVDADDFEREVARARTLCGADPEAARVLLQQALGRWRGDAFADADAGMGRAAATRLGMVRADAIELLAQVHGALGDHQAGLAALDPLLAEDPLRESAVLARATCLAAMGRRPDALAALRRLRHDLAEELGLDPGPAVGALEQQLLQEHPVDVRPPSSVPAPGLPTADQAARTAAPPRPATPTVGRAREVSAITEALDRGRMVTLVGPGGVGKSRLAMLVADGLAPACWVDLVEVDHPSAVLGTMLQALGVVQPGGPVRTAVVEALARFPGLVVVDNCEHLLDPVADLLDEALDRGGPVRLLATSRERLDLPGEQVVRVDPLPVPDPATASTEDPAVALFTRSVRQAGGPTPSPAEAAAVVAAVDGIPLGIELAATRAASIPVPVLAERLAGRMDLAVASRRRRDHRHGALTNVIRWSHDLLGAAEQRLFARLSVFAGPFRLQDVEAVCADDQLPEEEVAVALGRLVEQSMVSLSPAPGPVTRYRLLQPLRWYARRQLGRQGDSPGEWAALRGRHRDHVVDFAERMWEAVGTPAEVDLLTVMPAAMPDVRAVAARALEDGDLATAARLAGGLYGAGYVQARVDLLQVAQPVAHAWEHDPDELSDVAPSDLAAAVAAAAMLATFTEQYHLAGRWSRRAVELGTTGRSGVAAQEAWGDVCLQTGDRAAALAAYRRQHELAEATASPAVRPTRWPAWP